MTVQEKNAIIAVAFAEVSITEINAPGFISLINCCFTADPSDKDRVVNLRKYRYLYRMPQRDTIKPYLLGYGNRFLIYVTDGDDKDSDKYLEKNRTDEK